MGIYRTDEKWRAIIEAQEYSGLNPTQYCRQNAITRSAFCNAKKRLYPMREQSTHFIHAMVPADLMTPPDEKLTAQISTTEKAQTHSFITLELPHCTLRVTAGISPGWLASLIREMAP
ncbi:hypothetical protein CBG25_00325 [Arsenophonus sp. ENCA]|uniref:IS66 family insertion sequence element accessory protein TnpA n=1 Tax=Arsenophonus sp. ENCA TaxID=1987579 RepID=UPI000BDC1371|nr:hypothetical protein [Arsenophonus sp. ENCA]PAV11567.1 hypothetical protein CBG25_00325 [Arsenophonus sp. ENCA]